MPAIDHKPVYNCKRCKQPIEDWPLPVNRICDECDYQENACYDDDEPIALCHYCNGDGCGIVGLDWDCDDGVNGPYEAETERCPCCHGSGKAKDCTFW